MYTGGGKGGPALCGKAVPQTLSFAKEPRHSFPSLLNVPEGTTKTTINVITTVDIL